MAKVKKNRGDSRVAAVADLLDSMESRIAGLERSIGLILYAATHEQPSFAGTMERLFLSASQKAREENRHGEEIAVYGRAAAILAMPPPASAPDPDTSTRTDRKCPSAKPGPKA